MTHPLRGQQMMTVGSTFPNYPQEGDQHYLTSGPFMTAQLNGNPSNGATTLVVDNATITTATNVWHHVFLKNANGDRIAEGVVWGAATATTIPVVAQNWSTNGWYDDMYVEVGPRHAVFTFSEGRWKCPLIDRIVAVGTTDISTSSAGWVDVSQLNIYASLPTTCYIKAEAQMHHFVRSGAGATGIGSQMYMYVGGSGFPSGHTYDKSSEKLGQVCVSTGITYQNPGSVRVYVRWGVNSATHTVWNYCATYPTWEMRKLILDLYSM